MLRSGRPQRAVDLAAAAIRASVLGGEYLPGSVLPPEPVLAGELGISRLTLRAAIARLEAERLLRAEHGVGVRVLDYRATAGLDVVEHLVEQLGSSEAAIELVGSFLEIRRVLAAEAIALACRRCDAERLEQLRHIAALQAEEADPERFERRDVEFARELVRAAASPALELLLNTVERLYRSHPGLVRAMRSQRSAVRATYQVITDVVAAGDDQGVRQAVRQLLEPIDAATVAALASSGPDRSPGAAPSPAAERGTS
ncbi:MAG: FadR family transcriptional regulator [Deltaproteobacteria bacterium]|jgi:GntR family transcriptional repressor for pyruvate dehydrogenase complex|nr:FadR family transcriptional regulator [Deltaproteobacteria bacterium]MBW2535194.1 FadR family transcriptional regulator [Deltaproteobacteria bacterium]